MCPRIIRSLASAFLAFMAAGFALQNPPVAQAEKPYRRAFLPDSQSEITASSSRWNVELRESGFCRECENDRYRILIRRSPDGPERTLNLGKDTLQIDEIRIAGSTDRAVILGRVLPNSSIVHVVDLASATVLDSFWCFRPEVSPSGRRVAFVKIYPAHFAGGVSDHVHVYDVAAVPIPEPAPGAPAALGARIDVGRALYPEGAPGVTLANTGLPPEGVYRLLSSLTWVSGSRLAFVSIRQKSARLVVAEVAAAPVLRSVDLPLTAAVDLEACPAFKTDPAAALHVRTIEQLQPVFRLRLGSVTPGCLLQETLEVTVP